MAVVEWILLWSPQPGQILKDYSRMDFCGRMVSVWTTACECEDAFVDALIAAFPEESKTKGVYTEQDLKNRFNKRNFDYEGKAGKKDNNEFAATSSNYTAFLIAV
ncbi:hypothetical protein ANCDUO_03227 [Ancylostoma duodenale]|uniref:MICOS complex subunit MIC60 n=1 Tax=Ancylostoma duodenale TaxID=51022 RepID=A0A0C2DUG5_9BILA|nr:hypothetical protein ANCDUO_03227 [Ancylostoma duodenale]